jgi:hypothetical protein
MLLAAVGAAAAAPLATTEIETTVGYSSQGISAVAAQMRAFGETRSGLRFFAEMAGAARGGRESDAFATAYSYDTPLEATEAYVEQPLRTGQWLSGIRVGRYRTPFGIYGRGDQAYSGFLRPPLVRYGYEGGISNYWREQGVDLFAGKPQLQIEISLGSPQDPLHSRGSGLDGVVRLQGYRGPLIVGASYMRTRPEPSEPDIHGRAWYAGLDARWLRNGVQLRGEWISGSNFAHAHTRGWYVEALAHRPRLGPVDPVLRYEEYRFTGSEDRDVERRWIVGARVCVTRSLTATINFLHQSGLPGGDPAVDVGLTHTLRF